MSEWVESQLSDLCNIISVKTSMVNASLENYVSTENMIPNFGGLVKAEKLPSGSMVNAFLQDDVLFSNIRTYFKKVWFAEFSGTVSADVLVFRAKQTCDPKYLYYRLCEPDFTEYTVLTSRGAKMPRGDKEAILSYKFSLPSLPEQKAIASVLSSLDDKIDLLHRQNKTLEAMAETLFRQWFIEETKEDWGEIAFGELIELHDSKRVPLSQLQRDEKRVGQLYPYYGASGIIDYINAHIFEGDYLLLSEDGENLRTRKTPIAFEANGKFWVNNHAHVMQAKPPYTNGLLRILLEGENLDSIITGAVQPKINQANLVGYKIPNFPHDLVQQYVTVSDPWFKKVSSNKQQIQTLEQLRDTLLPKLMSGEVRVQYQTKEVA